MDLNKITPIILFAQRLLSITENNPNLLKENNLMKLEKNMFPKLSIDEFVDRLRTLTRRDVIEFENDDDLMALSYGREDFIWSEPHKLDTFLRLIRIESRKRERK